MQVEGQIILDFNPDCECLLDMISSIAPSANLTNATITEKIDTFGNTMYVVESERREAVVNDIGLYEIALIFKNDPMANARLEGNTLKYSLPNGDEGKLIETINYDGTRSIKSIEGVHETEIVIDSVNGEVLLDGSLVKVSVRETFIVYQTPDESSRENWRFFSRSEPDILFERAISTLQAALLISVIALFIPPWAGFTIAVATSIITFYRELRPTARTMYAIRRMYTGIFAIKFHDTFMAVRGDTLGSWLGQTITIISE